MKRTTYAVLPAAMLLLASCAGEAPWQPGGDGTGSINLTLTPSGSVETALPQTRAVTTTIDVPLAEEFGVTLTRTGGGYSKTWNSLAEFEKDNANGFSMGFYTMAVHYGDPETQGREKENAYFYGETELTIKEGLATTVDITAGLHSSIVYVEYGEAFKKYFVNGWSTTLQSQGHAPVALGQSEGENWHVCPGPTSVTITGKNQNGKEVTLTPASFVLQSGYMHKIKYDVYGGEIGDAVLAISFDDSVQTEDVTVDLTEELFSSNPPVVTPVGFTPGEGIFTVAGNQLDRDLKFNVMASAGIKSAVLTVTATDGGQTPAFGNSIQLIGATAQQQAQLEAAGVKAMGFFRNPDKMALLDVTAFCSRLQQGVYAITLSVTDLFDRASSPVTLDISTSPAQISADVAPIVLGTNQAVVTISYNGTAPTGPANNPFSFQVQNEYGYQEAEILSINDIPYTRAFESHDYAFKIRVPQSSRDQVGIKVYFNGNELTDLKLTAPVELPPYEVETDAFAKKAVLKVTASDPQTAKAMAARLRVFLNGTEQSGLSFDPQQCTATITGLEPETNYTLATSPRKGTLDSYATEKQFTTESAAAVPNGNFDDLHQTVNMTGVQVGGKYSVSPVDYTIKSSIVVHEPTNWVSVNQKTCYTGASNINTWFVVPSTIAADGKVTLRSVAYDHNGTTPGTSGGAFNTTYYCTNAPESIANRAAGELFLGSYYYTASGEDRKDGIMFASRPSAVSFDYTYNPWNNEQGEAYVAIEAADGTVIATATLTLGASSSEKTVQMPLAYNAYGKKAAKLRLGFRSTKGSEIGVSIPSGSALNEGQGLGNKTIGANTYHALATGSQLTVDNVVLDY